MRYAIFSDIHSNYEALEATLVALSKEHIDKYLCLGDIVGYGADPARCIAEIRKLNPLTIAGNHDWATVELLDITYFNPYAKAAVLWTSHFLTDIDRQFLQDLRLLHKEKDLTLVHGSLYKPREFNYILNIFLANESFRLLNSQICFIGHTHRPIIFIKEGKNCTFTLQTKVKLKTSQTYIVNAGSVGQPRDGNPEASYIIFDSVKKELEIKRVAYNIQKAQEKIIKAGLPRIFAERLALGM